MVDMIKKKIFENKIVAIVRGKSAKIIDLKH